MGVNALCGGSYKQPGPDRDSFLHALAQNSEAQTVRLALDNLF
jgi:hypothetical protein